FGGRCPRCSTRHYRRRWCTCNNNCQDLKKLFQALPDSTQGNIVSKIKE
ncbi:GSCOCG00008293001-RA-CDS, partial [Cotesia congregata]